MLYNQVEITADIIIADMHHVGVGTDCPHAQIKFLKQEIKQKRFQSNFELKKLK